MTPDQQDSSQPSCYLLADKWLFTPDALTVESPTGQQIALRKKNASVLLALINANNQTVSTEQLYQQVWGSKIVSEGVIKCSIYDLRNLFEDHDKTLIVTIPKTGYRLAASVETQSPIADNKPNTRPSNKPNTVTDNLQQPPTPPRSWLSHVGAAAAGMLLTLACCAGIYSGLPVHHQVALTMQSPDSILIQDLIDQIDNPDDVQKVLKNAYQKFEAMHKSNPQRLALAYRLIDGYLHADLFDKAVTLSEKVLRDNEDIYGQYHASTVEIQHRMVDVLTAAGQRQAAHNLAQLALQSSLKYHSERPVLLANSYFRFAQVKLSCVFPYCNRPEALNSGHSGIDKAIELLHGSGNENSVAMADALLLKNWFINVGQVKITLLNRALAIYLAQVGKFDERTAQAYVQLGRTRSNWQINTHLASGDLHQASTILTFLYGPNASSVHRVNRALAEQHLFAEDFNGVINTIGQMIDLDDPQFSCDNNGCLSDLSMLTKAYLYQGDRTSALALIPLFSRSIYDNKLKLSFSLSHEIKTLILRVSDDGHKTSISLNALLARINSNEVIGKAANNNIAVKALSHEWFNLQLHSYPQSLDMHDYLYTL
ncbi:MAG: winged helix-turn-helix domain-containing protein, partial [Algicola sp.]|nr:winged helix-turn-helix domain-containing protein [Algicola sp.]